MAQQLPEAIIKVVKKTDKVKVHTFISPEAFLANATHIIEGPHELILIDGQFVVPYAMQFRAYADSLKKPISRVYLTHDHVDHFFGISAAFGDVDVYALKQTTEFLKQHGEEIRASRAKVYGDFVPKKVVLPKKEAKAGKEVIDGTNFEFICDVDTETGFHLSMKLPDLGIFILQDLIYSGAHVYLTRNFSKWISILEKAVASDFGLFLPGHGIPADKKEVQNNINYLKKAKELFEGGAGQESLKKSLIEAFPKRSGAAVFDIYLPRLYGLAPPY